MRMATHMHTHAHSHTHRHVHTDEHLLYEQVHAHAHISTHVQIHMHIHMHGHIHIHGPAVYTPLEYGCVGYAEEDAFLQPRDVVFRAPHAFREAEDNSVVAVGDERRRLGPARSRRGRRRLAAAEWAWQPRATARHMPEAAVTDRSAASTVAQPRAGARHAPGVTDNFGDELQWLGLEQIEARHAE